MFANDWLLFGKVLQKCYRIIQTSTDSDKWKINCYLK